MDAPPAQYDHSYAGTVIEMRMTAAQVNSLCIKMGASDPAMFGQNFLACSWKDVTKRCYIVIPDDENYTVAKRHEIAHCNGWPKDHPR